MANQAREQTSSGRTQSRASSHNTMPLTLILLISLFGCTSSFTPNYHPHDRPSACQLREASSSVSSQPHSTDTTSTTDSESNGSSSNPHNLPPELLKIANAFETIGDDKLRYKQLLFMANSVPPIDDPEVLCQPENQVPGCLSTVYITATVTDPATGAIAFQGDSDGLLTKGLVALLMRGCAGSTADAIAQIDPQFIQTTGIAASLTPGRNNGFLNMLAVMKQKAREAAASVEKPTNENTTEDEEETVGDNDDGVGGPMYRTMVSTLQTALKPTELNLQDVSYQHAGHAEAGDGTGESHFDLVIVSEAFSGLNLVKRHQLVYRTLSDVMPKIHALQIQAKTPDEVSK